ncbi:MAG TPA: hypothetical protein VGL89_09905 [Candidatus Koribacter sp.]|jgi:hypothetical protein
MRRFLWAIFTAVVSTQLLGAQTLSTRPPSAEAKPAAPAESRIDLTVPSGTPIKIALDREVKIRKVGQPIHGKVVDPVYAFDKLVVPAGTEATGTISQIDHVSKTTRTLDALNANFSPAHRVHVAFNQLILADGRHLPIDTVVTPAPDGVLEFVAARSSGPLRHQNAVSRNVTEAAHQAKGQWDSAMNQLRESGKMHKIVRRAEAELPVHGQYLDPGTAFDADLKQPLEFGTEKLSATTMAGIAAAPPTSGIVHARLTTPLSSATATKGESVEAVLTEPLTVSNHLLLPVGTAITGSVMEVHPARRFKRNGQLRILFHQVELPNGVEQKIESSLEGVEVARGENLALDAEGGAQVTSPRSRYFVTALQVGLATSAVGDHDAGKAGGPDSGGTGTSAANGASGFRLVGAVLSAAAKSRAVTSGFGVYGASMSVYSHFLARGRDVVYPKDMAMVIGLGTRQR